MKDTYRGVETTLQQVMAETDGEPLVTVPSPAALTSVVTAEACRPIRLVIAPTVIDRTRWPAMGRLSDMVDDGTVVREAAVDDIAVVGDSVLGVIDQTTTPHTGVVGSPDSEVVAQYQALWRDAEPVSVDAPTHSAVVDVVRDVADEDAVDDIQTVCRGRPADPIRLAIWGAAADGPQLRELCRRLSEQLDVSERTVQMRATGLCDSGLICRIPDQTTTSAGRPPTLVRRLADPPLSAPVRGALLKQDS